MTQLSRQLSGVRHFIRFIGKREQLTDLVIFLSVFIAVGIMLSLILPYPLVGHDSGNYILTAMNRSISGYRPVGYSWFLNFFHSFSPSLEFVYFAQYALHVLSTLAFLFSIKFFFQIRNRFVFYVFALLLILEPNAVYLTNLVLSDSVFNSLTLMFLTSILWYNKSARPLGNVLIFIFHLIVLYYAFNVRYVGLFYPLISFVFIITRTRKKMIGALIAVLPVLVTLNSYVKTKAEMKEKIGVDTFSGFRGWALANNAVSVIPYTDLKIEEIKDPDMQFIHSIVIAFPDSFYTPEQIIATSFMWSRRFPGKFVLQKVRESKGNMSYLRGWVYTGTLFNDYGKMLIRKYPTEYFRHFVLLNAEHLFHYYDIELNTIDKPSKIMIDWYDLEMETFEYDNSLFENATPVFKVMHFLRWGLFIIAFLMIVIRWKRFTPNAYERTILIGMGLFIICYFGFSIMTHPINNFRYLTPTYPIMWLFPLYLTLHFRRRKKNEEQMTVVHPD